MAIGLILHACPLVVAGAGHCTAPGHENQTPAQDILEAFCNLGYASELQLGAGAAPLGCGTFRSGRSRRAEPSGRSAITAMRLGSLRRA